ncbi:MAG: AroM family protein [Caldivirga sp.]|jgi:protein AroM
MRSGRRVGLVTIGESPRVDITSEIKPILGIDVELMECGALDGLSRDEIRNLLPKPSDYVLVTRLRDGTVVKLSKIKIIERMQRCINYLEDYVDVIGLLCTGDFPELSSRRLMVEPSRLTMNVVSSLSGVRRLGVIVHDKDQMRMEEERWRRIISDVVVIPVSAYTSSEYDFRRAAEYLRASNVDVVVLDSLGYSIDMRNVVREVSGKPVILPRTIMAEVIRELTA